MTPASAALVIGLSVVVLLAPLPSVASRAFGRVVGRLGGPVPKRHRALTVAVLVLVITCFLVGAYECIDVGQPFAYFNSLNIVPRWFELWVTRAFGSQSAAICATIAAVVVLDGTARSGVSERPSNYSRHVLSAGAVVPLGYPAGVRDVAQAGALAAWHVWFGQDTASFVIPFRETFAWDDLLWGLGRSVVYAVMLMTLPAHRTAALAVTPTLAGSEACRGRSSCRSRVCRRVRHSFGK